eukprot:6786936-Alexandrium_andersonii.AAC.1
MGDEGGAVPPHPRRPLAPDTWPQGREARARSAYRGPALHPGASLDLRFAAPAARGAASASQGGPRVGPRRRSQRSARSHHAG